jgi:hypothetical protein
MGKARRKTVDPEATQMERRQLIERLERGFQQVQTSEEYQRYLKTVARFHEYSVSNTMLIWMQRPDATHVAGFRTWLSLGRHVLKGERGIRIFAPMTYHKRVTVTDQKTGELNEEEIALLRFRAVSVFDISQTDGDELPEPPVTHLAGEDRSLGQRLACLAADQGLTVDRVPSQGGTALANGWYDRNGRTIWVDPELAPVMAAKTLCHEIAHHFAEHIDSRQEHETIAESVAYIVLGHFGIDSSGYSFGYLASWSDAATFKAKLGDIQAIASQIIGRLEGRSADGRNLGPGLPIPNDGQRQDRVEERARHDFA